VKKQNKHKNEKDLRRINEEWVEFDSKLEARRYDYLYLMLRAGKIRNLTLQKNFVVFDGFTHKGKKKQPITYTIDFVYERKTDDGWEFVADDAKGMLTEPTRMRQKMFLARYSDEYVGINTRDKTKRWTEKEF